ncbi:MAG TPA: 5-methyltetrahydropteroyltriglutamate--homocysteine S-methyltransferase [Hyphomicrobiaceae bacterium]|nr:5-methyltetrahydropteroyltriglutamate--homocysteine S-methyltransferase [Hyphomicrobiaceae bacterium]
MATASAAGPPFRAEVIGSLLRPRRLKDAGRAAQTGTLSAADYQAVLEEEVARVVARQEDIGLGVVTDGELARSSWFGFFFEGLDGFRLEPSHFKFKDAHGCAFEWPTCVAAGRIHRRAPITLGEYERAGRYVRRALVKATMPAPSAFHFFRLSSSVEAQAYPDVSDYFDDLVAVHRAELAELAAAGCRYVQLDEVPIAMLCDPDVRRQAEANGGDPAALLDTYIGLLARIAAARPKEMMLGMHLCRGNFRGRWMAAGGYEPVAEKLFNEVPVDAYLLEYDSDRAGDFAPLRFVPRDKRVILGLLSSKSGVLEDETLILRRIEEAARVLPVEQLGLSTQCGFASVAGGNSLDEDQQWAKLELIVDLAARVWPRR